MSTDLYLIMAYMGIFYLILLISNFIVTVFGYKMYKKADGKLNFAEYCRRRWEEV